MDTIYDSIIDTHEHLKDLLTTLSSAKTPADERESAFKEFKADLEAHSGAEERFLYSPVLMFDEGLEKTRHGIYEHEEAADIVEKMEKLDPSGEAFLKHSKELSKEVRHHMKEEEEEYFRVSTKVLDTKDAIKLNEAYVSDYERLQKKLLNAN